MSATFTHIETYEIEHCCSCGIPFAVTRDFQRERIKDRTSYYCPSGHAQAYVGKTEAQKERERAERLQRQVEAREADLRFEQKRLENERRAHAATKGQLTKTKKRVANGVCPCCNRSFVNLGKHMAGQHPDYADGPAK